MTLKNLLHPVRDHDEIEAILSRTPVLTYHKIDPRNEFGINALGPEKFRQQMQLLYEEGIQPITFQDLLYQKELPGKTVIITFDDAYESVFQHALPILAQFGFRAVIYVIGGFIGKLNTWDVNPGGIRFRHMTAEQIQAVAAQGWEVGAHTMTHRALTRLNSRILAKELGESQKLLQDLCQQKIISLAYPFGLQNLEVRAIAGHFGFVFACQGIRARQGASNRMMLLRIPVYQLESLESFRKKLRWPQMPIAQKLKLAALSWPANLTPFYQRFFRRELFLDKEGRSDVYFNATSIRQSVRNIRIQQEAQNHGK